MHRWADQLLLQLLMEQFDTLPIQWRHIEHMHKGVWFRKKYFLTKWQLWELRQFSLIRLLYMHRWCLHGSINSYYSFWWNNLILCQYNVDTLKICMKEFGSQKISLTKWQLWELGQLFPYKAFVYALIVPLWADQLLPQIWWSNLIAINWTISNVIVNNLLLLKVIDPKSGALMLVTSTTETYFWLLSY